jgi:cupin 2 domain-containing protein
MEIKNIFQSQMPSSKSNDEIFETILKTDNVLIERIISKGQVTPEGKWYDQKKNELVLLLQGKAVIEFENSKKINLKCGDYIYLPAHKKHRVTFTSKRPHCIWLAIFFSNKKCNKLQSS